MKDPLGRTKVVMRHLPPAITEPAFMEQIDGRFSGRYNWVRFCPGKNSQKDQRFSRAYIDLKRPGDVLEFAEFFDGHMFVNEKGAQFKVMVEYAPSQCVPKVRSKKDGREGSLLKDPEYLEFLEFLAKPVENLPSAEIQLERREAERSGGTKEAFVVTPLMDFIRQKRAARSGSQRANRNGKLGRRAGVVLVNGSNPPSKRGFEKRGSHTLMYVTRDSTKDGSTKDKSTYVLVSRKEEKLLSDKPVLKVTGTNGTISGVAGTVEQRKKVVILKGKGRDNFLEKNVLTSSMRNSAISSASKQNYQQDASGRNIRSTLSHKEGGQNASQSEQQMLTANVEKDKQCPRPPIAHASKDYASISSFSSFPDNDSKKYMNDKVSLNGTGSVSNRGKHDKRTRNKGRPALGVYTPSHSDGSHSSEEIPPSCFLSAKTSPDSLGSIQATEVKVGNENMVSPNSCLCHGCNAMTPSDMHLSHRDIKHDTSSFSGSAETRNLGGGRIRLPPVENGSLRHVSGRGPAPNCKEVDSSFNLGEERFSRRGPIVHGSHERRVWVQKSGSAS